ncbi:hypothetical protein GCM10020219_017010 [Nonomuraea dietziae]
MMMDLLRWHGAEEVEHRSVAFDLYTHLDGSYARRARTMALTGAVLLFLLRRGAGFLLANDPIVDGRMTARWTHFLRRSREGRVPTLRSLLMAAPRYLRPGFPPQPGGRPRGRPGLHRDLPRARRVRVVQEGPWKAVTSRESSSSAPASPESAWRSS